MSARRSWARVVVLSVVVLGFVGGRVLRVVQDALRGGYLQDRRCVARPIAPSATPLARAPPARLRPAR